MLKVVRFVGSVALIVAVAHSQIATAQDDSREQFKPVPAMQVTPQPYAQASVERGGHEIARYWFGADLRRPFIYPVIGPSGRSLTRMGHPHDPDGHRHHNSVWISHNDVNGVVFWGDQGKGKIVQRRVVRYDDSNMQAFIQVQNAWVDEATNKTLIDELRTMRFLPIASDGQAGLGEWLLVIDIELAVPPSPQRKNAKSAADSPKEKVTLGKTPFGLVGVRMAKSIGVHDGGGTIRNSEGGVDEKGVFWKQAKWVDYSGRITDSAIEGITLFDHPKNPNHPTYFHVRDDGWMGTSLTHEAERVIEEGSPLKLRYGIWVHGQLPAPEEIEKHFEAFTKIEEPPAVAKK